ncbi:hypothetical protein ACOMOD_000408 [Enterococcus faecalis]|uniref:hypothetical protein n=1 Tax=Enterococcus faecalis TaxID=1351 RepID=UPI00033066E8|nr:hypothetical protein [Enterococcus faecalis]EOH64336.1 hypothetical protein UA9_01446 [Enterococcus faecalis EnGen0235]MBW4177673.1 hypothetical protein [Enterococcus faecalis]NRC62905.1 hypothetical protein [Enterococcus faecalis]PQF41728.1 hypothetical protein CUS75_07780 [Enterococcus faecalis]RBR96502.1 hypothetical protein EB62_00952 [Enterococcus faecalis]
MKLTSVTFKTSAERFPPLVAIDLDQLTPDEYVTLRNLGYDTQLSKITKRTFEELEGHLGIRGDVAKKNGFYVLIK